MLISLAWLLTLGMMKRFPESGHRSGTRADEPCTPTSSAKDSAAHTSFQLCSYMKSKTVPGVNLQYINEIVKDLPRDG